MINNKGQTLIIFVIFLPIMILLFAFIVDTSIMYVESNKLNSINNLAINTALDDLQKENIDSYLKDLIKKNDNSISKIDIDIKDNNIKIKLEKESNSIFGNVIGIKNYDIVSEYTGSIKNNKKVINKG